MSSIYYLYKCYPSSNYSMNKTGGQFILSLLDCHHFFKAKICSSKRNFTLEK